MERCIEAEWLDRLPVDDPGAIGSRRDLRVLNFWMGNAGIVARALTFAPGIQVANRVIELGTGDGHFLLQVARRLGRTWKPKRAVLIDRQNAVASGTRKAFAALGWELETVQADVFDWLEVPAAAASDLIITNLFAHHFDDSQLAALLLHVARHAQLFISVEPRRSLWALCFSRLLGIIGCNRITRHDAPASVRAGFKHKEISRLWPANADWVLKERPAGMFSHLFIATRNKPQML